MKYLYILFLIFQLIRSSPGDAQERKEAQPSPLTATAKEFVSLLSKGDFSGAVGYYDQTMKTALPEEKLKETWKSLVAQVGPYQKQTDTRTEDRGGYTAVIVTCAFEKMSIDVRVVFDKEKRVAGLFFAPAASTEKPLTPGYAKPDMFREIEVTVGTGEWALPGTLTLPSGPGPFPAVALVHGSGPNDRDETIGPNKPFRDLAWGLASRGIAVLRYEKRTRQYAAKLSQRMGRFTVKEETIDDALAAVALLRKTEGVDAGRIFVLGHSLGGMLISRIGARDANIAGLISLAGSTRQLEDVILEQTMYIASLDGNITDEEKAKIEELKKLIDKIKKLTPADADSSDLIMGAPASYYLDLRGYDPPAAAKKLKQPILILQGERDYQVTMVDFQRWKDALSARSNVTFKSYPALNHLFIAGSGKIAPSEYMTPGNVAEEVIADISAWIKKQSLRPSR